MSERITVELGDMASLTYPDAAFDFIWREGAGEAMSVINECNAEIAFYEQYPHYYGYAFLVMARS